MQVCTINVFLNSFVESFWTKWLYVRVYIYIYIYILHGSTDQVKLGLLIAEVSRSDSDTSHLVGRLWMSDRSVAEPFTWQHTILTRDRHPYPWRDSNPQCRQARYVLERAAAGIDLTYYVPLQPSLRMWTYNAPTAGDACTLLWRLHFIPFYETQITVPTN